MNIIKDYKFLDPVYREAALKLLRFKGVISQNRAKK
jgi:hypothetical protein